MQILVGLASVAVVLQGISYASWLLGPLALAMMIVVAVSPIPQWLRDRGLPSWLATTVLVLLVYAVIAVLVLVVVVSIAQLATLLPAYAERADALVAELASALARFGVGADEVRAAVHGLDFGRVVGYLLDIVGAVGTIGGGLVFLLSLLLFLSIDAATVRLRQRSVAADRPELAAALSGFAHDTRRYLWVTTVFGFLVAVLDAIGLLLLDIPLPLLWGVLSFVTNYVPNIGFILGVAPPALLALLQGDWQLMIAVIVLYVVVNFVLQSVIQPRVIGDTVGLSSTATFLSLIVWSAVLGPLGSVLAVPLTLLVKAVLVDVDPRARWVDALAGAPSRVPTAAPADAAEPHTEPPAESAEPAEEKGTTD
ncbi:putative PurR-regulated permease PerM [Actinokineospora auranticolor]|uniref:Putative PurR-regulated permease PerM n=1 Tax=Actinokineospora auranticolor TaxID=155976 RepID=A0A2S6H1R4_9PSEU|nr:putative PurR-regulated permease PerM [Actinokineospora auranticolor]